MAHYRGWGSGEGLYQKATTIYFAILLIIISLGLFQITWLKDYSFRARLLKGSPLYNIMGENTKTAVAETGGRSKLAAFLEQGQRPMRHR